MSYNIYPSDNRDLKKNQNIIFSENSYKILEKRYLLKNKDGVVNETPVQMFSRIARVVAEPDRPYIDPSVSEIEFFNLISTKKFFPNSPTFTGAGTALGQLSACFVLPIKDDLGKNRDSIFGTLNVASLIQQSGGGNGFSFSFLRPKGSRVKSSNGVATGPVGFLQVYDTAFGVIAQGGIRRGANMAVMRVNHPDIREFIKCKSNEGKIANFNISVAITNDFMDAVKKDITYNLIDPNTHEIIESPKAKEIFDLIVEYAYKNGEPGVLFIDKANEQNPVPHLYTLEATNPCGEQWLGPYENCCLGSINLNEHLDSLGNLDWEELKKSIILSTRFLDNVVTANKYVEEVPELREAAYNVRRIGLGFMGLADAMYSMKIRYGSEEGQEFASQVTEFIRYHSMMTSIELSKERGPFKKIKGSIYDKDNLMWKVPTPLKPYSFNFNRPFIDWNLVLNGLKLYGIRNGAQTTVAPTGTISTVAGVEGYGCEPVFALAYYRNVYQSAGEEGKLTLTYVSPYFQNALDNLSLSPDVKKYIIDKVISTGSCQGITELPESIRNTFVVSSDITPDQHIKMQASIQAFIDNSISKTCNLPANATKQDVAEVYIKGWESGCKGLTVYVTGSRQEVVLETKETKDKKSLDSSETINLGSENNNNDNNSNNSSENNDNNGGDNKIDCNFEGNQKCYCIKCVNCDVCNFNCECCKCENCKNVSCSNCKCCECKDCNSFVCNCCGCKDCNSFVCNCCESKNCNNLLEISNKEESFSNNNHNLIDKSQNLPKNIEPRGYKLSGSTYKMLTPQGKAFITINKDKYGHPLEIFMNVGKAGSDVAALSEALGRVLSGWLRSSSSNQETAREIVKQLSGIGGSQSVGFGKNKVGSIADAVAKVLAEEYEFTITKTNGYHVEDISKEHNLPNNNEDKVFGDFAKNKNQTYDNKDNLITPNQGDVKKNISSNTDMCSECGNYSLVFEEGCAKCYQCGYSKC